MMIGKEGTKKGCVLYLAVWKAVIRIMIGKAEGKEGILLGKEGRYVGREGRKEGR